AAGWGLPTPLRAGARSCDAVPLDLVGVQMQLKAGAVAAVDGGVLGLVGVVHHAVLAVFHVGVHFDVVVGAEPGVQLVLAVGRPQDGPVERAAVDEAVGQAADVDAATLAVVMGGQLDFLVPLDQDLGAFQCVDALFALAEIHVVVGAVGQDEVAAVLVPVVLVVIEGEAGLFFHAQHAGQLQETALVLVAARLAHADQAAAVPDE